VNGAAFHDGGVAAAQQRQEIPEIPRQAAHLLAASHEPIGAKHVMRGAGCGFRRSRPRAVGRDFPLGFLFVMLAKAGTQGQQNTRFTALGARLRGHDEK
jgi:hypothetical protein